MKFTAVIMVGEMFLKEDFSGFIWQRTGFEVLSIKQKTRTRYNETYILHISRLLTKITRV